MTLRITTIGHHAECLYAKYHNLSIVLLNVVMLGVVMLNGVMLSIIVLSVVVLSVFMLSVFMLSVLIVSVITLSVFILSVVMLSVMVPSFKAVTLNNNPFLFLSFQVCSNSAPLDWLLPCSYTLA